MFFADYKRQQDFRSIGSYGKVGELVVVDRKSDGVLSKFELPAIFTITETHGEPGGHRSEYSLRHQLTGETLNKIGPVDLYRVEEYFRIKADFAKHVERALRSQIKHARSDVALLSKVLASRGIVTVITEAEQVTLKKLIELEEAKKT